MTTTENQRATPANPASGFTQQPAKVDFSSRMAEFVETGAVRASTAPEDSVENDETDKKAQKAQLREAYETTKKSLESTAAERESARKEAAELKQALEDQKKELAAAREEALAAKKRIADVSYLESDEYKEKWVAPRTDAVNRAALHREVEDDVRALDVDGRRELLALADHDARLRSLAPIHKK